MPATLKILSERLGPPRWEEDLDAAVREVFDPSYSPFGVAGARAAGMSRSATRPRAGASGWHERALRHSSRRRSYRGLPAGPRQQLATDPNLHPPRELTRAAQMTRYGVLGPPNAPLWSVLFVSLLLSKRSLIGTVHYSSKYQLGFVLLSVGEGLRGALARSLHK